MPRSRLSSALLCLEAFLLGLLGGCKTTNCRYGDEWQSHPRYGMSAEDEPNNVHQPQLFINHINHYEVGRAI